VNAGKQLEIHKRGLPAFVVFPAFAQSGRKHRFALIFCALFDQAKSARECFVRRSLETSPGIMGIYSSGLLINDSHFLVSHA
jgi:hypothetical protein